MQLFNTKIDAVIREEVAYYADGTIWVSTQMKDGLAHGESFMYFPNQSVEAKVLYKNGKMHGKYEIYYKNGHVKVKGYYKNGKEHGTCIDYYENGNLKNISTYIEGNKTLSILYYNGGQVHKVYNYFPDSNAPKGIVEFTRKGCLEVFNNRIFYEKRIC